MCERERERDVHTLCVCMGKKSERERERFYCPDKSSDDFDKGVTDENLVRDSSVLMRV